jgi:2,3-dihydroxyphenylpropionate 1,2-dioxygenase
VTSTSIGDLAGTSMQPMCICASHSPLIDSTDGGSAGQRFVAALQRARAAVARYEPDLVVFFGPDHSRALPALVPAITVVSSARGYGDWGTPTDEYKVPADTARGLAERLLAGGFDVALGADMHLDHGFGQSFMHLFGDLGAVPCLPIILNCARPPLPSIGRVIDLGAAVGRALAATGQRVAYVGSGGLSHQPPSMRPEVTRLSEAEREAVSRATVGAAGQHIDPDFDRSFLRQLTTSDWQQLRGLTDAKIDDAGSGMHEIRTWLAAWAAARPAAGDFRYEPVPEWITGMGLAVSSW